MPRKPPTPCAHPTCGELAHGPRCEEHARARQRRYDEERGTSTERGYDARHRRWRKMILARDPICVDPYGVHEERGELVPSTDADHIVPLRAGGDWSMENGQGLCHSCHSRKTAEEDGRWG